MNTPISFELAKLLKEKRYNKYCRWSYWEGWLTPHTPGYALEDGTTSQENYWDFERYYAPTIADVVMWLYEKHGIWIHVHQETKINGLELIGTGKFQGFISRINHTGIFGKKVEGDIPDGPYRKPVDSPTEAYEAAIEYTLKNLI